MLDIVQELIDYERYGLHHVMSQLDDEKKVFLLITLDHILQIEELVKEKNYKEIAYIEIITRINDSYNENISLSNQINSFLNNGEPVLPTSNSYKIYDIYVNIYDKNKNMIDPYSNDEEFFPVFEQINKLFQQLNDNVEFINKNTSIGSDTSLHFKVDEYIGENLKNMLLSEELKASLSYSLINKQLRDSLKTKKSSNKI